MDHMEAPLTRVLPSIRRVGPDDLEFIARLSDQVFRRWDPSAVRNVVRMVKNPASEAFLVASGDMPLGFAVVHLRRLARGYGPWARPVVAHLDAIAVRPEFSGRGLGALLLETAEAVARSHGAVSISLLTAVDNRPAKRLFHAAGYQLVTSLDDAYAGGRRGLAMMKGLRSEGSGSL
jgi:ribosomal protein S18 acetylase RimI-like enzyme